MAKAIKADAAPQAPTLNDNSPQRGTMQAMLGESRLMEPTVSQWQPEDDSGNALDNGQVKSPSYRNLEAENRAKAEALLGVKLAKSLPDHDETPAEDEAPQAKPAKVVKAKAKPATDDDEIPEVTEAKGDEDTETVTETAADTAPAPAVEPVKPTRKDIMANLQAEKQRRQLEQTLKQERAQRAQLEATLTKGSILEFAKARGITRDQAMDELLLGVHDLPTETTQAPTVNPEVAALKADVDAMKAEKANRQQQELYGIVQAQTASLDLPLLRASRDIPIADDNGNVIRRVSANDAILIHAETLWRAAGSPDDSATKLAFMATAAEEIEEALTNDNKAIYEAMEKKLGRTKTATTTTEAAKPTKKSVPALGKKSGGGAAKPAGSELSMDFEERKAQIAARFGFNN